MVAVAEAYKLEDLVEITSSKRIFYNEYVEDGIPFYRSKEIIEKFNKNSITTELFITEERYNSIKEDFGVPKEGDILLTSVGTLGIPYLVKKNDVFYFKDGNLTWFRNFDKKLNSKFLFIWLISQIGKNALENITIGSTQKALTIQGLKSIRIDLPDLNEQAKIIETFDNFDLKIELNNKMNRTLEQISQAIFKHWFIDFEFPNENGKPYKSFGGKMVGDLPENWKCEKLSKVARIEIGRTPPRKEEQWFSTNGKDIKWISIKDMGGCGAYIHKTNEYLTKAAVEKFNIPQIPENTLLLSFKLTIGRLAITTETMLSNEAIAQIKSDILGPEFLYLYLKTYDFQALGSTSSIASAMNSTMIKDMPVLIPTKIELNTFYNLIKPIFEQIKNNLSQNQNLSQLCDLLLPRLMSGKN
jgi:type I restriction enzyme S subunit